MNKIGTPKIDLRGAQPYLGIRAIAPVGSMSKVVTRIARELRKWIRQHSVETAGPPFLRFNVIDMQREYDITFGYPVASALAGDERVTSGVLEAGRYASLIYSGNGYAGNKALIEWVRGNGMEFDRWDSENGDNFRCRYETYLTDPSLEHRKTMWDIEVAIKLAD